MTHFNKQEYDSAREWMQKKRSANETWDRIRLGCKDSRSALENFLHNQHEDNDWPTMTIDEWEELVALQKESEEESIRIDADNGAATIFDPGKQNAAVLPTNKKTSWQTYRKKL